MHFNLKSENNVKLKLLRLFLLGLATTFVCTGAFYNRKGDMAAGVAFLLLYIFGPVLDFLGGFGVHLVVSGLFPDMFKRQRLAVKNKPVPSFFLGAVLFLFLLVISLVTMPIGIGIILFVVLMLLLAMGLMAPAANLGDRLYADKPNKSDVARARTGWFAYCFFQYLPIIGFLFTLMVSITGLGALVLSAFQGEASTVGSFEPMEEETEPGPEENADEPKSKKSTKKKS